MNKVLLDIINNSKSRNEILLKYFGGSNGQYYQLLNEFIIQNQIDISHLEKKVKICPNCGEIVTKKGNKFCNSSCSASFTNKNKVMSDETKTKIRSKLIGRRLSEEQKEKRRGNENKHWKHGKYAKEPENRNCKLCGTQFLVGKINRNQTSRSKFCSDKCRNENSKILVNERIANGTHNGWSTRNIVSYPERFFIKVLNKNKIKFEHNYPVSKRELGLNEPYSYFLDFFIENKKIDLEIDGKQHKDREDHDEYRDINLIKNGFLVYRIKWKSINTEKGKIYMKNEIEKFLKFYNTVLEALR
jgi:very-short-patch-repair endonuclease/endogenous inhibitor of DNA gyrase (YacG/DUF329 family)